MNNKTLKISKKEISGVMYNAKNPFSAQVVSNTRITATESNDDIRHIVLNIQRSKLQYIEGQSLGVIPGVDEQGKPHKMRLYSISSPEGGDEGLYISVSLCVKRLEYIDNGKKIKGLCSNYLCDRVHGDKVSVIGPIGRTFILPTDKTTPLIMLAVGTGIAPFRAFIHHIYKVHKSWDSDCYLFYGSKTENEMLYMNYVNNDIGDFYTEESLNAFHALSRHDPQKKVYVQHRLDENRESIWKIIKSGHFCLYICGLKGMQEGIDGIFRQWAASESIDWDQMKKNFISQGKWNVEIY